MPESEGDTATTTASAAAYEEEKPARELTGWVNHAVTAACVLIGVFAIYQVFFPLAQGNQVSLIYFLAAVLPLTLLCYRSGCAAASCEGRAGRTGGATRQPDAHGLGAGRRPR
jgi:hypothetical protein